MRQGTRPYEAGVSFLPHINAQLAGSLAVTGHQVLARRVWMLEHDFVRSDTTGAFPMGVSPSFSPSIHTSARESLPRNRAFRNSNLIATPCPRPPSRYACCDSEEGIQIFSWCVPRRP